jgi:hypothetical protein
MGNRRFAIAKRWTVALLVAASGFGGNASATLIDRGPDMVYDSVLNITWTRKAGDGIERTWPDAKTWAAGLVVDGLSGWRLPYASVIAGAGPTFTVVDCRPPTTELQCRDNEMGYMYYYDLGGVFPNDKTGTQTAVGGQVLTGIGPDYWSGTDFLFSSLGWAWGFYFDNGLQGVNDRIPFLSAWAVRPGDVVAAAPEPATLALLGLGLAGLGFSRRKQ